MYKRSILLIPRKKLKGVFMGTNTNIFQFKHSFGYRQVPVWYNSSKTVCNDFETIAKKLKFLKVIPNPVPFYDWIMGFYERASNRNAFSDPILERVQHVLEAGVGTGYLLSQIVRKTGHSQNITAIDLSTQMLKNAKEYLSKHNLLSKRIKFEQCDCLQLPYSDEAFDLYVSSYLFDLLNPEELNLAIKEMERILVPDGHAILITMTTELDDIFWPKKLFYRIMNELYCLGYSKGRWNTIWKFLFAGYAPHCRPIALGEYLNRFSSLAIEYTKVSHVSFFPVRIYYVRKIHK
jgi:ubiquinone/menaquinone biosynthesis C-methylase UbiE